MNGRRGGGDAGETLVELLITVTLLGIVIVALLAGLATAVRLSDTHRAQANADVALEAAAEAVKAAGPDDCGGTPYNEALASVNLPSGWSQSDLSVTGCSGSPLQTITIHATAPDGNSSEAIDVVKRVA